jgi:hypothetical protein
MKPLLALTLFLLFLSAPLMSATAPDDLGVYNNLSCFSQPTGSFQREGNSSPLDIHRDLGFGDDTAFGSQFDYRFKRKQHLLLSISPVMDDRAVMLNRTIELQGQALGTILVSSVVIAGRPSNSLFPEERASSSTDPRSATDWSLAPRQSGNADFGAQAAGAPPKPTTTDRWKDPSDWQISIYPVYGWAPVFGINTRESPVAPGGGGGNLLPPSDTSGSLNGAAFAGFRVDKSKWSTDATVLWASLSSERDSNPFARISMNVIYGQVMAGREILPNFFLEGGVRRMSLDVSLRLADFPTVSTKPGVWDPLVGLTYRRQLTKKWRMFAHADGGGFGVGTDEDVAASVRAEWQFARHFGLTMGYGALHFGITRTVNQESLELKQTLHGPIFGFGIYF